MSILDRRRAADPSAAETREERCRAWYAEHGHAVEAIRHE